MDRKNENRYILADDAPNREREIEYWTAQSKALAFRAGKRSAVPGSPAGKSTGIPLHLQPPAEVYAFIYETFQRTRARVPPEQRLHPRYEYYFWAMAAAHFLWIKTAPKPKEEGRRVRSEGFDWLLRFYGVHEVDLKPFEEVYVYYFLNRRAAPKGDLQPYREEDKMLIGPETRSSIRVYEQCEPSQPVPISDANGGPMLDKMHALLKKMRDPFADNKMELVPAWEANYVSKGIHYWFKKDPGENEHDPIVGRQWAWSHKKQTGKLFFPALAELAKHKPRVYRFEYEDAQSSKKQVQWLSHHNFTFEPMVDFKRKRGMTKEEAARIYTCKTCHKARACVPVTGEDQMCCHCRGTIVDEPRHRSYGTPRVDRRAILDLCTRPECYHCNVRIKSPQELNRLKNEVTLNPSYPVRRSAG